jgi:hypothetical protein
MPNRDKGPRTSTDRAVVRPGPNSKSRSLRCALSGLGLVFVIMSMLGVGTAIAAPAASGSASKVRYARFHRVCPAPTPGHPQCLVIAREPVPEGTPGATAESAVGEGEEGGYTPAQFAKAYDYNPAESGYGQTVAVIDSFDDPDLEKDVEFFDNYYKLGACTTADGCFKKVGESGKTTELPGAAGTSSVETTLDAETVRAVCPHCNLLVVEGVGYNYTSIRTAVKLGAKEISNSWEGAEGSSEEEDELNFPGVVVTASSGDFGYYDWSKINKKGGHGNGAPNRPAALPTIVAVGGTTLLVGSDGERSSEKVWNEEGPVDEHHSTNNETAGGGCSLSFTAPAWQQNVLGWAATGCGNKRLVADVSADASANPGISIYDTYNCGKGCEEEDFGQPARPWRAVGGTSLSSPIIASMFALAGGSGGVSYPAATLYSHFGQSHAFYDVTEGGDGYCDAAPESLCGKPNTVFGEAVDCEGTTACDAATGYDGPSGVGVPIGLAGFRPDDYTDVTQTSATLQARVTPDGNNVTSCEFEYGTGTSYGKAVSCRSLPGSGDAPVLVAAAVAGLSPSTAYHFRVATNSSKGTLDGPDVEFTTSRVTLPSVETKGAGDVGESSATIFASVNPRGGTVSKCTFEYGTSTSYGSSASCSALPGSGSSPVTVSTPLAGLAANTEYHYRISATNSSGTSKGGDTTLKTT